MSEWIRHRGSKSMPKCLEGKRFHVRLRNGYIYDQAPCNDWENDGSSLDVMAYRILGDIDQPDYSKGFPVGTTAKDIGAKVGDEFVAVSSSHFSAGEIVTMDWDDGTMSPRFTNGLKSRYENFAYLAPIQPKTAIELQAEEVGIPEPVQLVDDARPDADGWIEWKGGDCPVPDGTMVDVKYRCGHVGNNLPANVEVSAWPDASMAFFRHDGDPYDITSYRLHHSQEWPEDRIDVIGQNGNDGLHYDAVPNNKYQRTIKGVTVDVYDVLSAFGVTCQARGHAIKKLLMAGQRGHKNEEKDLREAVQAIERSIDLLKGD